MAAQKFTKLDKSGKPGKVIRVSPTLWKLICEQRRGSEAIDATLRRAIGLKPKRGSAEPDLYVLPSDLCKSEAEARGRAILKSVREKRKELAKEAPLKVKPVP